MDFDQQWGEGRAYKRVQFSVAVGLYVRLTVRREPCWTAEED